MSTQAKTDTTQDAAGLANLIGEVELLVSGAALFATLKLPGWLGAHLVPLAERFSDAVGSMIFVLYTYLASAATILALTFAVHLALRARWIALVGLHRAFPAGVRWKRLKVSPLARAVIRRRDPGAAGVIKRASDLASMVFAGGLVVTGIILLIAINTVLAIVLAYVAELAGHPLPPNVPFLGIPVLLVLPIAIAGMLDTLTRKRNIKGSMLERTITHVYGFYARIGVIAGHSMSRVLLSHGGQLRSSVIAITVMLSAMLAIAAAFLLQIAPLHFGSYAELPHFDSRSRSSHVLDPRQYADQRDPLSGSSLAYIQERVITGPYLQLTVPYEPSDDGQAILRECPEVAAATGDARALAALECLTGLHPVTLDGQPLAELRYQLAIDRDTRRPLLRAMIDIRALTPGRHELRVAYPPDPDDLEDESFEPKGPWVISFWL